MSEPQTMIESDAVEVRLFVDPSCPFAWITSRWLAVVEVARPIKLEFGLVSLSVINAHADLDPDYRAFNDAAWRPARVAAAAGELLGPDGLRAFYEAYGQQVHVQGVEDRDEAMAAAVRNAGLPAELLDAADDTARDEALHAWTAEARDPVHDDAVGTPIVHLAGAAFFGPVLTSIPRGAEAVALFDALHTLARTDAFTDIRRGRVQPLETS